MSRLPLAQWDPSLFKELQHLLALVASQPTTSLVHRLNRRLEDARPWILALTALPAPNEEDKKFIASSPVSNPNGTEVRITDELLATTNTISEQMHLSHLLAAVVALQAVQARPRYPARSDVEIAVYVVHDALNTLLDFVHELLRLTIGPEAEQGEVFDLLRNWVEELLDQKGASGYLADVAVDQLDVIQTRIDSLARSQATGAALELVNFRVGSLRAEQNRLAGIIGTIALGGYLKSSQIVKLAKWLKKCPKPDAIAAAVLAAFCAATQPIESLAEDDPRYESVHAYMSHSKFVLVISNIVFGETFAVTQIRDAVKLHWCLFYLSAIRNETSLAVSTGLDADAAERNLQDAVAAGALQFLTGLVSSLHRLPEDPTYALAAASDPENNMFLYTQLEQLVHLLAGKRHFLRNLKNKEEDVSNRRSQTAPAPANFQAFMELVATVYQHLPADAAQHLWDENSFTSVALDNRSAYPSNAFWDMVTAISNGPICAAKCYEKFKDTRFAWANLFKFYTHYISTMPHLYDPVPTSRQVSVAPMSDDEYYALHGWTRVLTAVVKGSALARGALLQAKPHPLQVLFDFVNCDISSDLKAVMVDAITAFVTRRGDSADEDVVSKAVEQYERISFADATLEVREGTRLPQPIGWLQRMELIEQDLGRYWLLRAYMSFLTALIPSDKPRVNNALRRGAMFIIDRVLLANLRYREVEDQWGVMDGVMAFLEQALQSFDLTDLLTPARGTAAALADQPGFLILLRMLSEPAVFTPLQDIIDHATTMGANRHKVVGETFLKVLRIFHRILDVQLVFSDVLLLTLASMNGFKRPLGFQSIDHYLLNRLSNVTGIALAVGDDDLSISFVSLKIINALAQSPLFSSSDVFRGEYAKAVNRLAGIIDASDNSIRIAQGFCTRMSAEGEDLAPEEIDRAAKDVFAGKVSETDALPIVIRSAILDMLVEGTADPSGPNIAHFLLGFDFRARELGLQDPRSPDSRQSCLTIVLQQLGETPPLITLHPVLAAKSAQLVHQLFAHPVTGPSTMAYATSYEGFPARQLASLPRTCPPATHEVAGLGVVETYTEIVETSAGVLVAYLDFQKHILSAVALQTYAYQGHGASGEMIADLLFNADEDEGDDQRPPLLIDLVSVVDIVFKESNAADPMDRKLEFYNGFNFDQFKRGDSDWYDLELLARALRAHRRQLERQGAVIPGKSADAMTAEAAYCLRLIATMNRKTEISIAKGAFLAAWLDTLKVSLVLLFKHAPEDRQEALVFDLLTAVLDRLSTDLAPGVLGILCEAVLAAYSTLVELLAYRDSTNLPIDRLEVTLLKVVDSVIRPGTTETARGNLYAAVSQFLQLVPSTPEHALHRATVTALGARKDRFVAVLARDAMDMRDVWKTECYSLLAAVVGLGDRNIIAPLKQAGYLAQFVRSVKDREMALQECLSPDPENLHAYWVYEAKVAFLTAYAASPQGSDDLVDAGVFEVFATCGFISVQPLSDDILDDVSTADTVLRQHRVLACALQLLVRVLSSPNRSGSKHALSFLNAHRESLLVLMRENQVYVTTVGIDESRLVVALLALVAPKVAVEDLQSSSGFRPFHLAVLSLAAKFFDPSWKDVYHPTSESSPEAADAKVLAFNQVLLSYLVATTNGLKAGAGHPVFVTGVARGGAQYIASAPSLPSAVDYIAELADTAQDVSAAYDDVADDIENGEELPTVPGFEGAESLDELQALFASRIKTINNMIEELLLLVWRHMLFYSSDAAPNAGVRPDTLSLSFSTNLAASAAVGASHAGGAASLKALERVAASLRGTLERLDDVGVLAGGEDAYGAMLVRRLRELCAGLVGE